MSDVYIKSNNSVVTFTFLFISNKFLKLACIYD